MNPEFFIHIGLHKTGTTFLQRHVFPNWPSVHYIGKPYSAQFVEPVLWDETISTVLMSNEQFSSPPIYPVLLDPALRKRPWFEQRKITLLRLKAIFPKAKVIVGVRTPAEFCESVYSQYILRGGWASLEDFWRPNDYSGCLCLEDIDFDSLLTFVEGLWPGSFYFDHADLRSDPAKLLAKMARFMGVDASPPVMEQEINARLSESQVFAMRDFSEAQSRRDIDKKSFYRGLMEVKENTVGVVPFSFPESLREEISDYTSSSWGRAKSRMNCGGGA